MPDSGLGSRRDVEPERFERLNRGLVHVMIAFNTDLIVRIS